MNAHYYATEYTYIAITFQFTWFEVVVPVRVSSLGQMDLFENYLYYIGILETI